MRVKYLGNNFNQLKFKMKNSSLIAEEKKDNASESVGGSLMVKPLLIIFIILLIALIGLVGWQYSFNKKVDKISWPNIGKFRTDL